MSQTIDVRQGMYCDGVQYFEVSLKKPSKGEMPYRIMW